MLLKTLNRPTLLKFGTEELRGTEVV